MGRLLFVVEDRFLIKGRGLVPVPGIVPQGEECFRAGDPILLKRPLHTQTQTRARHGCTLSSDV